jgi:xanthine dehydrogenase molybdopterin-binding subunit B
VVYRHHTYIQDAASWHAPLSSNPTGGEAPRIVDPPHPEARAVTRGDFVGVVAPTEWEAIRAAADLKLQWSGGGGLPSMTDLESELRRMTSIDVIVHSAGDVEAGLARSAKSLRATYCWPFQSHASIGPSCAVADVRRDGGATVLSSTQDVYAQREALARLLGVPQEKVRVIYVEGSGCYGHNGSDDANADAALLSKEAGYPVRVQWMRHDEFGWEPRGAPYLVDLRVVCPRPELTGWDYQAWAVTHSARYRHYGERISGYLLATQLAVVRSTSR